jgi:ankyrin repeat protein
VWHYTFVDVCNRFRWVSCQLDHLCSLATDRERMMALQTLPPTLSSTYDRILERLNKEHESVRSLVEGVLKWLIDPEELSNKSLTELPQISARELCVAVSTKGDRTSVDLDGIPSVEEIVIHSSSFLRMSQSGRCVEFAHFTVEEYLRSINPQERPELARYCWDELKASAYQVETCLTFLNMDDFRPSLCGNLEAVQQLLETHPFYARASILWPSYPNKSRSSGRAMQLVNRLFDSPDASNYNNWLLIRLIASKLDLSKPFVADPPPCTTSVSSLEPHPSGHLLEWNGIDSNFLARSIAIAGSTSKMQIAAMFRLVDQIPRLFETGSQLNALSSFGTSLHCALLGEDAIARVLSATVVRRSYGYGDLSSTVSMLVELGADARIPFDARSTEGILTPLSLATRSKATQQLLDSGAVLDENTARAIIRDLDGGTSSEKLDLWPLAKVPLESVDDHDRRYVGHLLTRIDPGRLAAPLATAWGQATMLELDGALQHACQCNELSVLRWIFEVHNLDVNYRFQDDDASLLHVACRNFAADVVSYLMGKSADMSVKDTQGRSLLACYFDSKLWNDRYYKWGPGTFPTQQCLATLHSIIGHEASNHGSTDNDDNALLLWAKCRSTQLEVLEEVLRVLLCQGVDIGSRNTSGKNVWHCLASRNHVKQSEMLKSLVDSEAFRSSIDVGNDLGYTPILEAAAANQLEMFEFLAEQGCDINSRTRDRECALHLAAAGIWSEHCILPSLLPKYPPTENANSTSHGSSIAHHCVRSITSHPHPTYVPEGTFQRFKESIEALLASSVSITDADASGKTPLDQLCQWIAKQGHHSSESCSRCEVCFRSFEVLVAHEDTRDDRSRTEVSRVTWTTSLLQALQAQVDFDNDQHVQVLDYPEETICTRAICLAIDKDVLLDNLGAEFDLDSIFEIAVRLRQESLILKLFETASMDFDKPSRKAPHHTPLQALCTHGCPVSTIRIAISRTKDVCASDPQGFGPLHMLFSAAKAQHTNMAPSIRALLDAGVDIDGNANRDNCTPLMMAAAVATESDAVVTLLDSGAKIDIRDVDDWNALLLACHTGTQSAIKELVNAGSAFLYRTVEMSQFFEMGIPSCGPLHLTAARGMSEIVKILLELERPVEENDNNDASPSPLLMACVGNQETVRLLLECGHDPNLLDISIGMRPLHAASRAGNVQIVRTLLEAGCSKEAPDIDGIPACTTAIVFGQTHVVEMLERFNHSGQAVSPTSSLQPEEHQHTCVSTTDVFNDQSSIPTHSRSMISYAARRPRFGETVVHHSLPDGLRRILAKGSLQVIERLAKGGLNMGGRFKSCTCTPMLVAVERRHLEVVTYLVSIGVPLFTEDSCSLHFENDFKVVELLASHPIWTQLIEQGFHRPEWCAQLSQNGIFGMIASAIDDSNLDTLGILLDEVASPFPSTRIVDWEYYPSEFLHQAATRFGTAAISCASMLLSYGLDVDCLDRSIQTPLQIATSSGQSKMVKLLLSHNAAVNVVAAEVGTALSIAARQGRVNVLNLLLTSGADPNLCVSPALAPVTLAAENGQYAAFQALVDAGATPKVQDYYALSRRGYRSALMLDEHYFCATQDSQLLDDNRTPRTALPVLRSMPSARRALCFATLCPGNDTTLLYSTALDGSSPWVDFAVQYGAAVNMEGGPEGTPLMAACYAGHLPIVERLVQSGALLSYWNGTRHVSAFVKARLHPRILRWLLVGRFTKTLRLAEMPTGGDLHLGDPETSYSESNDVQVELILKGDIENYLERTFWFVPARRFVDSGDGSFDSVDILPCDFAKYKPGFI